MKILKTAQYKKAQLTGGGDYLVDRERFQYPGGSSALRRQTKNNPRNLPCPTCKQPNKLTPADVRSGYKCEECTNRDKGQDKVKQYWNELPNPISWR
jgi:hypothetical protein